MNSEKYFDKIKTVSESLNNYDLAEEISEMIIESRYKLGISQKELARKIGTKQPSIARLESGEQLPSLNLLNRIAKALDTILLPPILGIMLESSFAKRINNYKSQMSLDYVEIETDTKTSYTSPLKIAWKAYQNTSTTDAINNIKDYSDYILVEAANYGS